MAETSQQPISQVTWLKVTPHCNLYNHDLSLGGILFQPYSAIRASENGQGANGRSSQEQCWQTDIYVMHA